MFFALDPLKQASAVSTHLCKKKLGPLMLGWTQTEVWDGRRGRPYSPSRIAGQINAIATRSHQDRVDVPPHCLPLEYFSTLQSGCSSQKKNPASFYHFWLHRRRIYKGFSVQKNLLGLHLDQIIQGWIVDSHIFSHLWCMLEFISQFCLIFYFLPECYGLAVVDMCHGVQGRETHMFLFDIFDFFISWLQ